VGATSLMVCLRNPSVLAAEACLLLLEHSPAACQLPDDHGNLPLHCCAANPVTVASTALAVLDAFPAAVERRNHAGQLPLALGLRRGRPQLQAGSWLVARAGRLPQSGTDGIHCTEGAAALVGPSLQCT
jgi:hypothetical protein